MNFYNEVTVHIKGKGYYENSLDEDGEELEWLNGAALKDGCYCKYYQLARDWSEKKNLDEDGLPSLQHYCSKKEIFMGWSSCCWSTSDCFEKGKSAGVKRYLNKIRKERQNKGLWIPKVVQKEKKRNFLIVKCSKCNQYVPLGNFCSLCGEKQFHESEERASLECPFCGKIVVDENYCTACGHNLDKK